jgi:hypothetical protein
MSIPFTQYILPNGRTEPVTIEMPAELERKARELITNGCHFDIEILHTGIVSMTCEKDDDMLSIELSENGPAIMDAVTRLVEGAYAQVNQ